MSALSYDVTLAPETVADFDAYIVDAEKAMRAAWRSRANRLWSDREADRAQKIRAGETAVEMWSGTEPVAIKDGLIHDWTGAVFVPGATVAKALALMQDYNHHQNIYKPEVISSKLISRRNDDFKIYMRLLKKKVITVVLDTEHDVRYSALDANCWTCRSCSTRIAEVQDPGTSKETILPPGTGYGFLWRIYSYWLLQGSDAGTIIECRAISLTRTVPWSLKLVVQPIVRNLPRESLEATLKATKDAVLASLPSNQRQTKSSRR